MPTVKQEPVRPIGVRGSDIFNFKSYLLHRYALIVACLLTASACQPALAADPEPSVVQKNLANPCGLAVRPGGTADLYELFFAETSAGRVSKLVSTQLDQPIEAIAGFETEGSSKSPLGTPGPRGLCFFDSTHLVVSGGDKAGQAFLRLYELNSPAIVMAEKAVQKLSVADDPLADDVRTFQSLARTQANEHVHDLLIASGSGSKTAAGLWQAGIRAGTLSNIKSFDAGGINTKSSTPAGIVTGTHGYIVIADATKQNGASELLFCHPDTRAIVMRLPLNLPNVIALAYSPRSGSLYAANFAAEGAGQGGIYRIDDTGKPGEPACTAARVADAKYPTAMAFAPDGALFITASPSDSDQKNTGTLMKLTGDL